MASNNLPNANNASVRLYKRIALTFIGLTLVLLGVVLAATLSRAVVTVTPKQVPLKAEVKVAVAKNTQTAETVRGLVIAATVSDQQTVTPAGTGKTIQGKATGTVLLVNKRAVSQSLVATTRLLTKDGVLFHIKKSVNIPANGELKDVEVYADGTGSVGEIGPSTFTIPGLSGDLQKLVYAFSEKPMKGGVATEKVIAQNDIDTALAALKDALAQKAMATLTAQAAGKGLNGSATFVNVDAQSVSAKAGETAASFDVLMKVTVTGVFYDEEKLANLGLAALRANLPADMDLGSTEATAGQVTVQNADAAAGTATLDAVYGGQGVITATSQVLDKSRLVGLDAETIKAYLKSFDSVADASVKFSPFWVKRAPTMREHIEIIVK